MAPRRCCAVGHAAICHAQTGRPDMQTLQSALPLSPPPNTGACKRVDKCLSCARRANSLHLHRKRDLSWSRVQTQPSHFDAASLALVCAGPEETGADGCPGRIDWMANLPGSSRSGKVTTSTNSNLWHSQTQSSPRIRTSVLCSRLLSLLRPNAIAIP